MLHAPFGPIQFNLVMLMISLASPAPRLNDLHTSNFSAHTGSMKKQRLLYTVALLSIACAITLSIDYITKPGRILSAPDAWTLDWQVYLLAEQIETQRTDIALVLINESTLAEYRVISPIDRTLLASLVRAIDEAGANVIGLDFQFERPADSLADSSLLAAIKTASAKIVVATNDGRSPQLPERALAFQREFVSEAHAAAGHPYFQRPEYRLLFGDEVTRRFASRSANSEYPVSFASQLAGTGKSTERYDGQRVAWQRRKNSHPEDVFFTIPVMEHAQQTVMIDPDKLILPPLRDRLAGRTVLIGTDFSDRDQHLTPISLPHQERFPGVFLHAQALAQMLDGRALREFGAVAVLLGAWAACFAGILIGIEYRRFWVNFLFGTTVFIVGVLVLKQYQYILSSELLMAWTAGISAGHFISWSRQKRHWFRRKN